MAASLHISAPQSSLETLHLVSVAIEHEKIRLELSLRTANRRLAPFEQKYHITSDEFYQTMAAEDLDGGDDEYIQWAGEYELRERLRERLEQLRGLQYEY